MEDDSINTLTSSSKVVVQFGIDALGDEQREVNVSTGEVVSYVKGTISHAQVRSREVLQHNELPSGLPHGWHEPAVPQHVPAGVAVDVAHHGIVDVVGLAQLLLDAHQHRLIEILVQEVDHTSEDMAKMHLLGVNPVVEDAGDLDLMTGVKVKACSAEMFQTLVQLFLIVGPDYDDTPHPEFLNPSWMSGIPDSLPLSEVTMPGTHNTMALFGGPAAKCQSWNLTSQLRAGVRFLDIRLRHVKGNLTLHHWIYSQKVHFGHVLRGVVDFLDEYLNETVLMRVKEELSKTNNIYDAVVRYVHRYARWDMLWHSRLMPTMGQARGKLIVLQDFPGPDLGMRYGSLDIADDWKVFTIWHVPKKWQSVQQHLELAPVGNKAQLFLTFTSGNIHFPLLVAKSINAKLYDYLGKKTGKDQRFGVIAMDYPAAPVIQMIIDFN
ncbi:hypothetical protein CRUP_025486 [Coryphaenoides rupestris]|nr:hypothetical protein CRUP_025486 [Coryphaenoides rupestris]